MMGSPVPVDVVVFAGVVAIVVLSLMKASVTVFAVSETMVETVSVAMVVNPSTATVVPFIMTARLSIIALIVVSVVLDVCAEIRATVELVHSS